MRMIKISAVVICFNNEDSIEQCLQSLHMADEIIVLDSFSSDGTLNLLQQFDCTVHQQTFKGFARQKQDAINLATHDWVLLLDSDEFLTTQAQDTIKTWSQNIPNAAAYELPRREWLFWQWSRPWVRMNKFVRLFDRHQAQVSSDLVHESIKSSGQIADLNAVIKHRGETSIKIKISKINQYSQLAAEQKFKQGTRVTIMRLLFYPIWYFFKQYFLRRQIFNGVAGLINAVINSYYAFLKYAKLYELQKNKN